MNGGQGIGNGVTLKQIAEKMTQANVSRVKLTLEEIQQLVQTLAFDYLIEQRGVSEEGEALFVVARRVTTVNAFGWWDVLEPDFHFRTVRFEDGVVLSPHGLIIIRDGLCEMSRLWKVDLFRGPCTTASSMRLDEQYHFC
jgi:hypothetical protein